MTDSAPIDLGREWAEMADSTPVSDRSVLWLFPVLLLYVGVFFGPWGTVFAALFAAKGRIGARGFGIVVGTCGTVWCVLQGLSIYNGAYWAELELQSMRSVLNFFAGVVTYVTVRPIALRRYRTGAWTFAISAIVMLIGFIVFIILPARLLVFAGR